MTSIPTDVVPLALGSAVSPTLLTLQLLIMSGRVRPVGRAWCFTLGVGLATGAYIFVVATIASSITLGSGGQSVAERVIKLAGALLLVLLGVRALRRGADQAKPSPKTSERLRKPGLGLFVGVGIAGMATNFTSLILILPATHDIVDSPTSMLTQALLLAFVFLCALAPVLFPVLAVTLLGSRSDKWLSAMHGFTQRHAKQINAGIAFIFAALLAYGALK